MDFVNFTMSQHYCVWALVDTNEKHCFCLFVCLFASLEVFPLFLHLDYCSNFHLITFAWRVFFESSLVI